MGLINRKRVTNAAIQRALGAPIGIDFGTGALKVLQLSGEGPYSLVTAGCVETPRNLLTDHRQRLDFQFESLPKLVSALPLKGRRAVCSIPVALTFCKHAQFPKQEGMPAEVLADTMLTEQLGRDASTLIRRLIEVPTPGRVTNKSEYICIATGREVVDKLMKAMRAAKLEVVGIHSEFEAALRAFQGVNQRTNDQHRATLYLDIGTGNTQCFIGHGRDLVFARTIEVGGHALDTGLAQDIACSTEQAHKARLAMADLVGGARAAPVPAARAAAGNTGDGGGVAVAEDRRSGEDHSGEALSTQNAPPVAAPSSHALREMLEILTDETNMGIRYHDAMFPETRVSEVMFVGGESRHRALCQHLAKSLRLPAKVTDPFGKLERSG
ncbi:MAG: pilus assembly protein PilM, partial [Phycisphaerales bacterium JB041]